MKSGILEMLKMRRCSSGSSRCWEFPKHLSLFWFLFVDILVFYSLIFVRDDDDYDHEDDDDDNDGDDDVNAVA